MRRVLKWVWAPALLAASLVFVPTSEAKAQNFGYYYGGPRVSFGFSSGYGFGPPACPPPVCAPPACAPPICPPPVCGAPYGGYYGRRVYGLYPPYGPRPYYSGYRHGPHRHGYPW